MPKVWAWCDGKLGSDQAWAAIAEDGEIICEHISSDARWGAHDVSPKGPGKAGWYAAKFGDAVADIEYIVCPLGEGPPNYVFEAYDDLQRAAEGGES